LIFRVSNVVLFHKQAQLGAVIIVDLGEDVLKFLHGFIVKPDDFLFDLELLFLGGCRVFLLDLDLLSPSLLVALQAVFQHFLDKVIRAKYLASFGVFTTPV